MSPHPETGMNFNSRSQALTVSHPILLSGRRIGTLVLLYDLE